MAAVPLLAVSGCLCRPSRRRLVAVLVEELHRRRCHVRCSVVVEVVSRRQACRHRVHRHRVVALAVQEPSLHTHRLLVAEEVGARLVKALPPHLEQLPTH